MTATVTKSPRPRSKNIDWKPIEELYLQGFLPKAIEAKTGINSRTIAVHMSEQGISKQRVAIGVNTDVEAVGKSTRAKIAAELERTVDKLAQIDPKRPEMLNLHADTLQKTAKTGSIVHGWGDGAQVAVIIAGVMTGQADHDDQPEAIDVESTADD